MENRVLIPGGYLVHGDINSNFSDIYWSTNKTPDDDFDKAICFNQNGFKRFTKEVDWDVDWDMCFSAERFPHKYPCLVQLWRHFEGSMTYAAIEYEIPEKFKSYLERGKV